MKNHTAVYMKFFNYGEQEFVPCECCDNRATETNHIIARGMGGVKDNRLDIIENLMAICRGCHNKHGDNPASLEYLVRTHAEKINMEFETLMEIINKL